MGDEFTTEENREKTFQAQSYESRGLWPQLQHENSRMISGDIQDDMNPRCDNLYIVVPCCLLNHSLHSQSLHTSIFSSSFSLSFSTELSTQVVSAAWLLFTP